MRRGHPHKIGGLRLDSIFDTFAATEHQGRSLDALVLSGTKLIDGVRRVQSHSASNGMMSTLAHVHTGAPGGRGLRKCVCVCVCGALCM